MKKQSYTILAFAMLLAAISTSTHAQSDRRMIGASVPFNFSIKDKVLPAGEYVFVIVQLAGSDAIKIQSADGHITALVSARSARTKGLQQEPELVFNRYADQYFLASISGLGDPGAQDLVTPGNEERLAKTSIEKTNVSIRARKK